MSPHYLIPDLMMVEEVVGSIQNLNGDIMFMLERATGMWKRTMRAFLCALGVLTIGACLATPPQVVLAAGAEGTEITLVLTSDVYKMSPENGHGGLARIAGVLKSEKSAKPHVLTVHAGDTISPSLMSGFDKGAHIVELFNLSPLDVFVPGNHEFDFGPDVFRERMGAFKAQVLAANLKLANGLPHPNILPARIYQFGEVKIGVIGLTDENSPVSSKPGSLKFADSLEAGVREAAQLRKQGADLVVAVVHSPRDRDEELFVAGFADIILSGHDHDLFMRFNEKVAIVEAGADGVAVAAIDLKVSIEKKSDGTRRVKWWPHFRFIDTADAIPDATVAAKVAQFETTLGRDLDVPAGVTETELDSRNAAVRGGEAAIGNLFADAVREATKADVGLLNGGGFRGGKIYPAGSTLTRRDILGELPFLNKAIVLQISGEGLMRAIEQGFVGAENEVGRFPQVSGLTIRADLTRPEGKRVASLLVGGKPVKRKSSYRLATNDYLANGGDGYLALKSAKRLVDESDAMLVTSIVIQHLEAKKRVAPRLQGRIVVARTRAPN